MIRFKQRNSYENLANLKSVPTPPAFFFPQSDIDSQNKSSYCHWDIVSKDKDVKKHIFYLHGGAYVSGFSMGHWFFLGELYRKGNCHIHTPDYPLAPSTTADELTSMIKNLYLEHIANFGAENTIIMGDSAGGGLALALSQSLDNEQQASALYLLSPWLDLNMINPYITTLDQHDLVLNIQGLKDSALAYAGKLNLKDPRLSPIYGKLEQLPPIKIFTGTHDILMPDCRKLRSKLISIDKECQYNEIDNMLHCGMLYPTSEGKQCRTMIIDCLLEQHN